MFEPSLIFVQVLLTLIIGIWIGVVFKDTAFMRFFDKNNWIVGLFLILTGWINYMSYSVDYLRNVNLVLIIVGLVILLTFLIDLLRRK